MTYAAKVARGKVQTFSPGGESNYKLTVDYQPDSRLVVGVWENLDANQCQENRYAWDGALSHLIDHTIIGTGDVG
ncbi:hypothetical protein [Paraburkholderia sp. C35]|uniref:hypothetical protein n=1 Tax=Paraburkholderia sp. C35 TaxID=2126993 RepID=UPI000D689F82|nr:hypothetical protein [Paraburkholderia sp. C35]